jgi:hypothetical protein
VGKAELKPTLVKPVLRAALRKIIEARDNDKHSSLLRKITAVKRFTVRDHEANPFKLFTAVIYGFSQEARIVLGKPFEPSLMFLVKAILKGASLG